MSIKRSLMLALIAFSTIPIIVISMINTIVSVQSVVESKRTSVRALAYTNGMSLEEFINGQEREVMLMALRRPFVAELISRRDGVFGEDYDSNRVLAISSIVNWVDSVPHYVNSWLVDINGDIILSYDANDLGRNVADNSGFADCVEQKAMQTFDVSELQPSQRYRVHVMCAPVLDDNGETIGAVMLFVSMDFFRSFISNVRFDNTGRAFLKDQDGTVIFHDDKTRMGSKLMPEKMSEIAVDTDPRWGGRLKTFLYETDGITVSMCEYQLEGIDWILVTRQDYGEIMENTYRIFTVAIVSFVLWLSAAVVGGLIISRRFTAPIQKLQAVFAEAAENESYVACDLDVDNEIGDLSRSYNTMITRLNDNFEMLSDAYAKIGEADEELRQNYNLLYRREKENNYLAFRDPVTDLANRPAFDKALAEVLAENVIGGVVYIDIDNFKSINDIWGHELGDELLKKIGDRISAVKVADVSLCARVGGDEYMLIIKGYQREIETHCKHLLESFEGPFEVGTTIIHLTASVGIAMFPKDGDNVAELTRNSDLAMYNAKKLGKNTYFFFDDNLRYKIHRQNQILEILRSSMTSGEVFLVFQPEFDMKTSSMVALEALMRLKNKHLGFIGPAEFVPIAEANGLMLQLGYWAIEEACKFNKNLADEDIFHGRVSVNISAIQLMERDFVQRVVEILDRVGLEPHMLRLEITENVLFRNLKSDIEKLVELKKLGVGIALDDFGTSYSSMNLLATLPIDTVKIDRMLIEGMFEDDKMRIIVKTIIELAHKMDILVVAEGIQAYEQRVFFEENQCDSVQGYLYCSPLEEAGITDILVSENMM